MAIEGTGEGNTDLGTADDIFNFLDSKTPDDKGSKDNDDKGSKDNDDVLSLLDDDDEGDDDAESKLEKKESKSSKDTSDEDEESDEDNADDDDEDDELELDDDKIDDLVLTNIPARAQIKAAYPDIFKKFPALDSIIQREKQYTELFTTIAEAKEGKERLNTFREFEAELLSGDIEGVLSSVKKTDEKAYNKITSNYLATLYKVDKEAHFNATNNIIKSAFKGVYEQVKNAEKGSNEEQIKFAVQLLNKVIYNSTEVKGPDSSSASENNDENPEAKRLAEERNNFEKTKFQDALGSVVSRANKRLVDAVTEQIDKKGILPPYVKKTLVQDVMVSLNKVMGTDKRFKGVLDRLWMESRKAGYTSESKEKIYNALINRAKDDLSSIMKAKKTEAMKGLGSSVSARKKATNKDESHESRGNRDTSSKKITSNRSDSDSKKMKDGESVLDFFMRD